MSWTTSPIFWLGNHWIQWKTQEQSIWSFKSVLIFLQGFLRVCMNYHILKLLREKLYQEQIMQGTYSVIHSPSHIFEVAIIQKHSWVSLHPVSNLRHTDSSDLWLGVTVTMHKHTFEDIGQHVTDFFLVFFHLETNGRKTLVFLTNIWYGTFTWNEWLQFENYLSVWKYTCSMFGKQNPMTAT